MKPTTEHKNVRLRLQTGCFPKHGPMESTCIRLHTRSNMPYFKMTETLVATTGTIGYAPCQGEVLQPCLKPRVCTSSQVHEKHRKEQVMQ
jgi:hypothetical protein